jgi:ketosteroid isomerase-like protein
LRAENVELVRQVTTSWPAGDFRAAIALFTEDVEMSGYLPEGVLVFCGRKDVIGFMVEFGSQWEGYRVEVDDVSAVDDDVVLVSGRQIGKGRSSGLEISESMFVAIRLSGGRIAAHHWHIARDHALAAAGL